MILKFQRVIFFKIGFAIGFAICLSICKLLTLKADVNKIAKPQRKTYNEVLADDLFNKVKIMCLIMTNPNNHRTKAIHVRDTWGKKCDKLKFITTQEDSELDSIVVQVVNDTKKALRRKAKAAFLYTYDNYGDEFDWFIKADDDNYVIMENLRYLLYQFKPTTSFFFGHKQIADTRIYMSGEGYILSKKALEKLAIKIRANPLKYFYPDDELEDLEMGKALEGSAIFVDCRDELQRRRFLPGPVSCCSDVPVAFHFISGAKQYFNDYLVYNVHPFGLDKNSTETLPRKLPLNEIIAAAEVEHYKVYKKTDLDLESSERY